MAPSVAAATPAATVPAPSAPPPRRVGLEMNHYGGSSEFEHVVGVATVIEYQPWFSTSVVPFMELELRDRALFSRDPDLSDRVTMLRQRWDLPIAAGRVEVRHSFAQGTITMKLATGAELILQLASDENGAHLYHLEVDHHDGAGPIEVPVATGRPPR
jgi:hypothetical protein